MNKNVKYPIEAFALAMVVFSLSLKEALIVGIGLVFGDILEHILLEKANEKNKTLLSIVGALVTFGALCGMFYFTALELSIKALIGLLAMSLLCAKHGVSSLEDVNYGSLLKNDLIVYLGYLLLSGLREVLSNGTLFILKVDAGVVASSSFAKPMFALILAALVLALLNHLLKSVSEEKSGLWVCLPIIALEVPYVMDNVNEMVGTIVGILMVAVIFYTFSKKLIFSQTNKYNENLPVSLMTLGMIYMIVTLL